MIIADDAAKYAVHKDPDSRPFLPCSFFLPSWMIGKDDNKVDAREL